MTLRTNIIGAVALLLAGCGRPPSVGVAGPEPARAGVGRDQGWDEESYEDWLPAGSYFRHGSERHACEGCIRPEWVVALGPFATGEEATAAIERERGEHLPPGYPWAVHSETLVLHEARSSGILVVLGSFETETLAQLHRHHYGSARVLPLASELEALRHLEALVSEPSRFATIPRVVQIDSGGPVLAHAREDVEPLASELDRALRGSLEGYVAERDAALGRRLPRCEVAADSVHAFVGDDPALGVHGHFVPVSCPGGEIAYVPWDRTRLDSVVRRVDEHAHVHHMVQRIPLEPSEPAFEPHFEEWAYDRTGRHTLGPEAPRLVERGR